MLGMFERKTFPSAFFWGGSGDAFCSLPYVCNLNMADYEIVINICKTSTKSNQIWLLFINFATEKCCQCTTYI